MFHDFFFFENHAVYEIMWKNIVESGMPRDNMAHAHCMLDTSGYKHTLIICNTYCFYTATVVARMPLHATLYVHCLSCLELPEF